MEFPGKYLKAERESRNLSLKEVSESTRIREHLLKDKVMIIDGETVITGSFNFTKAAEENNAENLLVIRDKELAERYIENWQEHDRHSEVYLGRGQ